MSNPAGAAAYCPEIKSETGVTPDPGMTRPAAQFLATMICAASLNVADVGEALGTHAVEVPAKAKKPLRKGKLKKYCSP